MYIYIYIYPPQKTLRFACLGSTHGSSFRFSSEQTPTSILLHGFGAVMADLWRNLSKEPSHKAHHSSKAPKALVCFCVLLCQNRLFPLSRMDTSCGFCPALSAQLGSGEVSPTPPRYAKFEQFCELTLVEKERSIGDASDKIGSLEAGKAAAEKPRRRSVLGSPETGLAGWVGGWKGGWVGGGVGGGWLGAWTVGWVGCWVPISRAIEPKLSPFERTKVPKPRPN